MPPSRHLCVYIKYTQQREIEKERYSVCRQGIEVKIMWTQLKKREKDTGRQREKEKQGIVNKIVLFILRTHSNITILVV